MGIYHSFPASQFKSAVKSIPPMKQIYSYGEENSGKVPHTKIKIGDEVFDSVAEHDRYRDRSKSRNVIPNMRFCRNRSHRLANRTLSRLFIHRIFDIKLRMAERLSRRSRANTPGKKRITLSGGS